MYRVTTHKFSALSIHGSPVTNGDNIAFRTNEKLCHKPKRVCQRSLFVNSFELWEFRSSITRNLIFRSLRRELVVFLPWMKKPSFSNEAAKIWSAPVQYRGPGIILEKTREFPRRSTEGKMAFCFLSSDSTRRTSIIPVEYMKIDSCSGKCEVQGDC